MFDIHKVKPIHGWREFFGEVGIIVLGVVIALGLEHLVEVAHWRQKVRESRETLAESVRVLSFAAIEQQIVAPCIIDQLDTLEKNLLSSKSPALAPHYSEGEFGSYVLRAPTRPWGDSVWSTTISEGVSTHFDPDFRDLMDRFYASVALERDVARQEDQIGGGLNTLSLTIPRESTTVIHFVEQIEQFRTKVNYMTLVSQQLLGQAIEVKMIPSDDDVRKHVYDQSGTIKFCRVHHLRQGIPSFIGSSAPAIRTLRQFTRP